MAPWDCFKTCGGEDSWSKSVRLNLIQIYCPHCPNMTWYNPGCQWAPSLICWYLLADLPVAYTCITHNYQKLHFSVGEASVRALRTHFFGVFVPSLLLTLSLPHISKWNCLTGCRMLIFPPLPWFHKPTSVSKTFLPWSVGLLKFIHHIMALPALNLFCPRDSCNPHLG